MDLTALSRGAARLVDEVLLLLLLVTLLVTLLTEEVKRAGWPLWSCAADARGTCCGFVLMLELLETGAACPLPTFAPNTPLPLLLVPYALRLKLLALAKPSLPVLLLLLLLLLLDVSKGGSGRLTSGLLL